MDSRIEELTKIIKERCEDYEHGLNEEKALFGVRMLWHAEEILKVLRDYREKHPEFYK